MASLAKGAIAIVLFTTLAAAPVVAPAVVGGLVTTEEVAASVAMEVGETAQLAEMAGGLAGEIGEGEMVLEGGFEVGIPGGVRGGSEVGSEGGSIYETPPEFPGGESPGSLSEGGEGTPGSNGGKAGKEVQGPKTPWRTKYIWDKYGKPIRIGWSKLAKGKTSILANGVAQVPNSVC